MKDTVKKYKWYIAIILVVIVAAGWWTLSKPSYEDTFTPKPLKGNPVASVKIVEFSDLQCPACSAAHPTLEKIVDEYGEDISVEYKHFPLTSIHRFAFKAAEAAECANDQGMFWEYIDFAFVNQKDLTNRALKQYAADLGLDTESFNNCLDSDAKAKYVTADYNEGIGRGVQGTPTFYINGQKLDSWQYDNFAAAIEQALAE